MSHAPDPSAASPAVTDIKCVPAEASVRAVLREAAVTLAATLDPARPPTREDLQAAGERLLAELHLPLEYLGYAMVRLDNAFWAADYQAVPPHRRLLLLPRCLSHSAHCRARVDGAGLHCAACGACAIEGLIREAQALGTRVLVAEGTSAVTSLVLEGEADAILGVACLDSLERSFQRLADLGIPHQALPLLTDGCVDTTVDLAEISAALHARGPAGRLVTRTYLPLLREARRLFEPEALDAGLQACTCLPAGEARSRQTLAATDAIARDWLRHGGKRLRPFITLAAYAVGRHGVAALAPTAPLAEMLPPAVRSLALAIEALHKASLVHDDIEDRDGFRYGEPTVHRVHGIEVAINVGDYLVGLGYRLIALQAGVLGPACIADILQHLSGAHLQLCCGQGAELLWHRQQGEGLTPVQALQIGALKTAPAFEVALYAGLRAAEVELPAATLRQFAVYVGEAYQVQNDLADWDEESLSKGARGLDALAQRPTILRALALEAGGEAELSALLTAAGETMAAETTGAQVAGLYERLGVFAKATVLHERLRQRALELAGSLGEPPLAELLVFLVRNILRPPQPPSAAHGPP